jgi:predicted O-methyltransferase YrrM
MVYSTDDDTAPSSRLIALALEAIDRARGVSLRDLDARQPGSIGLAEVWPGEHYRLLAGLVGALEARRVVEIGSGTGLSALTMLSAMPADARLTTFDIVPWREYPDGMLRDEDFADGRLEQVIADLTRPELAASHEETLARAQFIFVDAAKDGEQEHHFLGLLDRVRFDDPPVVMFDDIRVWNMLAIWRGVTRPKLDLTSFGHWSGTGLIDYA